MEKPIDSRCRAVRDDKSKANFSSRCNSLHAVVRAARITDYAIADASGVSQAGVARLLLERCGSLSLLTRLEAAVGELLAERERTIESLLGESTSTGSGVVASFNLAKQNKNSLKESAR